MKKTTVAHLYRIMRLIAGVPLPTRCIKEARTRSPRARERVATHACYGIIEVHAMFFLPSKGCDVTKSSMPYLTQKLIQAENKTATPHHEQSHHGLSTRAAKSQEERKSDDLGAKEPHHSVTVL